MSNKSSIAKKKKTAGSVQKYLKEAGKAPMDGKRLNSTTKQALRTGGWVNPVGGSELKFFDRAVTNTELGLGLTNAFSTPVLLNGIQTGSQASTRVGRVLNMVSFMVRYQFSLLPTTTGGGPIRIMLVYDKQANAVAAAADMILQPSGGVATFTSVNNLDNRDRFVTIADHYSEPISTTGDYSCGGQIFKKVSLQEVFNSGSTLNDVGMITSGAVYLLVAHTGGFGTQAPAFVAQTRIRFKDT